MHSCNCLVANSATTYYVVSYVLSLLVEINGFTVTSTESLQATCAAALELPNLNYEHVNKD